MFGWMKKDKTPGKAPAGGAAVLEKDREAPELKIKVLERTACRAVLSVVVPAQEVRRATEASFLEVQKQAKLPGFRPGKAPLDIVKKNFGSAASERALDRLLRESVFHALEKENVRVVATPSVDKIEFEDGKPLKFELKAECAPEVVLKDYKGLPLRRLSSAVAGEDVAKRLEGLRESHARLVPSQDEAVSEKHFVVVSYEGTLDGKPLEGGKAEEQIVEMAAPQAIDGFTEGLKGAKAGETRDIPVKFPADHPDKSLAGKSVSFRVTVSAVKEKKVPALDDDLAKDVGVSDLAEMKERIRKSLESERLRAQREDLEKQVIEGLLERHPFEVPPSLVQERTDLLTQRAKAFLSQQGAREEDWKANEARFRERNKTEAERQVRLSYVFSAIADAEKIEPSDQDVSDNIRKTVEGSSPDKADGLRKWLEGRRDGLRAQLKEEKIFQFLIDKATITEAQGGS